MFLALNLVLTKKQRFGKLIKWEKSNKLTLKIELIIFTMTLSISKNWCQIVKNWQKIIQKYWHLQHWVYHKEKNYCENIYSESPLYLFIDHAGGYVEEKDLNPLYLNIDHASGYIKKGINKYLVLDSTNKELLKKI